MKSTSSAPLLSLPAVCLTLIATLPAAGAAPAGVVAVTVSAPDYDVRETPVSLLLPASALKAAADDKTVAAGNDVLIGQLEAAPDDQVRLSFMVRDLKAHASRTYRVQTIAPRNKPESIHNVAGRESSKGVEVKRHGADVEFWIDGRLFTRYDVSSGPNKPYFYPLFAPDNHQVVRHWPLEKVGVETHDHPHHRGLWFTHGKLNDIDFWTETGHVGRTVSTGDTDLESGPVYGLMRATTDWIAPDNHTIARDQREVRVYNTRDGYLMDFAITVTALDKPLTWSDSKEALFGLRVADSMRAALEKDEVARGLVAQGHILNARGETDAATWGRPAEWCDYYGPVDGSTVGVAILSDPRNPHSPTHWQVRDYGLLAANPFGLHDFDKTQPKGKGDLTVPAGQSLVFRYRLLLHHGTTWEAGVAQAWQAFATPPIVHLAAP